MFEPTRATSRGGSTSLLEVAAALAMGTAALIALGGLRAAGPVRASGTTTTGRPWHRAHSPGAPASLAALAAFDPQVAGEDATLAWLQDIERCQAWLAARTAIGLVRIAGRERSDLCASVEGRSVVVRDPAADEIAAAMRWSPRTALVRIDEARDLLGAMAPLARALEQGRVSVAHGRAIGRQATRIPEGTRDAFVAAVLPYAVEHTAAETGRYARALVERSDPDEARRRRESARARCDVDVMDDVDGLSVLSARMPTADAHAVLAAVLGLARDPAFQPEGACTSGLRRVEALKRLVIAGPPGVDDAVVEQARVTARVDVVVSLSTITGEADDAALVAGGEPISAEAVRELLIACSPASSIRAVVTDGTGRALGLGRRRYAVSRRLRAFLEARDGTCRFPGCGRRASGCEIDHALPWSADGRTDAENLGALCARHHHQKTFGGWRIQDSTADGACVWESPRRRRYRRTSRPVLPQAPPLAARPDEPPF